jgi:hypothetical protein
MLRHSICTRPAATKTPIKAGEAAKTGEALAVAARAAFAEANLSETAVPALSSGASKAMPAARLHSIVRGPRRSFILQRRSAIRRGLSATSQRRFRHYPEDAKAAIDQALAVAPNDDWALASAGAWNIEVVRNGGALLARAIYGARVETGKEYFYKAFVAQPNNLVIRFQFALSLSGYDFDANSDAVAGVLDSVRAIEPRTVYEGVIKERALRLLDLIKANRRAEFLALVHRYQGYPS